ncbi:MAG: hypothetical protein H0X71_07645 [Rubrobacter sp.]|nr:hypothetical protein [Rubrobacter sp.]
MTQADSTPNEDRVEAQANPHNRQGLSIEAAESPERPALAPNVELIGEIRESGFEEPQYLIQRGDRFIQLTELLYRIVEQADGKRTLDEIATKATEVTDWRVSADNVRQLVDTRLIPLRIIAVQDDEGSAAPEETSGRRPIRSPLKVNMRVKMLGPRVIDPITSVLQVLFSSPVLVPVVVAIAFAHGWLYAVHGATSGILELLYRPGLVFAVLGILFVSGIFHEFGHAAALRYGGGKVRGMGVGLYIVYPAMYTDTTDSYRLGRWARVRTDLGGFYFHLIFALAIMGLYLLTGYEFLLVVVLLINFDIFYQCLPFVRFDGYWALADLTGIPDFLADGSVSEKLVAHTRLERYEAAEPEAPGQGGIYRVHRHRGPCTRAPPVSPAHPPA